MEVAAKARKVVAVDDAALIERAKSGDERALSQLYKRHARYVAGTVYRLLGNDHHLEDIVQDTFVLGLAQLHSLREPAALRGWLRTIAVRRVKRHLAQRIKQRTLADELAVTQPHSDTPDARDEVLGLYRQLDKIPAKLRLPWMLHYIEGETLPVVADMCNSSLSSVKRHIAKANKRLGRLGHAG